MCTGHAIVQDPDQPQLDPNNVLFGLSFLPTQSQGVQFNCMVLLSILCSNEVLISWEGATEAIITCKLTKAELLELMGRPI